MSDFKRILLVEDNPNDVELVLSALAENHLADEVVVARDGQEALDYLHRRGPFAGRLPSQPVVMLLDLKLPRVDGLEVLRAVKGDPGLRQLPVVMLTSSREERDLLESYTLGANAFVVKPVEFAEFLRVVQGLGLFWALINEPPPGSPHRER